MKTSLILALSLLMLAGPAHADRGGRHDGGRHDGGRQEGGRHGGGHFDGGYRGHHHGHSSFGLYFGAPLWDPYPRRYYDPFYDPYWDRPLVIEQQSPPVYIQRPPDVAPAPAPQNYWYYCPGFGYYPYVPSCNRPWMQVLPQPAQ